MRDRITNIQILEETLAICSRGYYGVNGNLAQLYKFWKYVKYTYYKVLNKRHQKRSMRYKTYLRIWNYYIAEPHLTKDIWNWKPTLV